MGVTAPRLNRLHEDRGPADPPTGGPRSRQPSPAPPLQGESLTTLHTTRSRGDGFDRKRANLGTDRRGDAGVRNVPGADLAVTHSRRNPSDARLGTIDPCETRGARVRTKKRMSGRKVKRNVSEQVLAVVHGGIANRLALQMRGLRKKRRPHTRRCTTPPFPHETEEWSTRAARQAAEALLERPVGARETREKGVWSRPGTLPAGKGECGAARSPTRAPSTTNA